MKTEEYDLLLKRKEMSKESWIKNVMRIHPDKTREETEALWQKIFEADEVARLIAPEQNFEDVLGKSMKAHGLTDELPDHLKTPDFLFKEGPKSTVLGQGYHIKKEFPKEQKDINVTQLKDKPDFEAIASKMYYDNHDEDTAHILQYAMNFVWSSHVEPLQKTLSRYSSQEVQISNLQSEITRLKEELQKYRPEVKSCPNCLSDDIQMFTSDLDRCKKCGQTF